MTSDRTTDLSDSFATQAPLVAAVTEWAGKVASLLNHRDREKAAGELRELIAKPPRAEAVVVVAGEDKRGKSSLVNALLGHPGLSPVGVQTVTAAPISMQYASEPTAAVSFNGESEQRFMPLEEAQSLATIQGNPFNEHNVRSVQISLPVPLLKGLILVDTPGVGGLDSGHAALTLQSLRSADALVFVLEAGAQIRGPELHFLREAASRTSRVIFVLTKVDLYRGWRQIAADNRAILKEHAPRLAEAPVVAVSSLLGLRAARLASADPEESRDLWKESGLEGLDQLLRSLVTGDLHALRAANIVQTALVQLVPIERALSEQVRSLASPQEAQAALVVERGRLSELNQERAEWPQTLNVQLRRLNLDRADKTQDGLGELRRRYDERLKVLKSQEHDALPGELVADLTAFAGEMNDWTIVRLTDSVTILLGELAGEVSISDIVQQLAGDLLTETLQASPMRDKLKSTDRINILSSYASGHSMIALLASGGLGAAALGPVAVAAAIGLGSIFAFERFRVMKRQSFAQEFKPWMNDQILRTQQTMNNSFQRTQIDVEITIRRLLKAALAERERQLNESLAACQRAQQQEQGARQQQREKLLGELRVVQELRAVGSQIMGRVATWPSGSSAGYRLRS